MKIFLGVLIICFIAGSALANTYIEYTLDGDWIYEEDYEGTLTLSENPSGGITATINVPNGIDDGGLVASRHDLPGFSLDNNIFIELEYSSLTSTITGTTASLDLCLEVEFFDSEFNRYEIAMNIWQTNESRSFETWFECDGKFDYYDEEPIPAGLSINEGTLGFYFHDNYVSAYFKDVENNLLYPFLDWDISQIAGTYGFRVDNDFEADTSDGGTVLASVNLEQVVYGPDSPVPDIKANGLDDPLFVTPSESVDISISLAPGDKAGVLADWWGILLSSYGNFPLFGFQCPLFELPETSLFSRPWPMGWYIFLFGLDDTPDGVFELDWYDYVVVVSQPAGTQLENIPNFDDIVKEKMRELGILHQG